MPVSLPVPVKVPVNAVVLAESVHARDFRMSRRVDPFHKLLYVQRGRVELHSRNGRTVAVRAGAAGAVLVIPAGREHRIVDVTPSVILLLCAGTGWLRRIEGLPELWRTLEARGAGTLALDGSAAADWERRWRRALLEQGGGRTGAGVLRDALALRLLVMLARAPERGAEDSAEARVRRVTREIDEGFLEPWTIDGAAAKAGLSRRHFTQWFRRLNGETLVGYLHERRLVHAQGLLESGRHTVTGAAFSSGFGDLAHFYRLFKRRHGSAPGTWLEREK